MDHFVKSVKRFFRQTYEIGKLNTKARYRNTFAGFIWVVLNPILMYLAQSIIFSYLLEVEIRDYSLFLLTGLLPWIFLTQSIDMCTGILVANSELLKSFKMNPFVIVVAQVFDNIINFISSFIILILIGQFAGWTYSDRFIYLPLCFLVLFIGGTVLSSLLSLLHVFYRDTKYVVSFIFSLLYFLTPIFYPESMVPPFFRWLTALNPIYSLIAPLRMSLYPGSSGQEIFLVTLKAILFILLFLYLFKRLWKSKKNEFYSRV